MWRPKEKRLITLLLIILLLFFIFNSFFRRYLIDLLEYPLKLTHFFFNFSKALIFFHYNFLENIKLTEEINLLKKQLLDYHELLQENKRLKAILSFKENTSFNLVSAKVILRPVESWFSIIVIDRGKRDGLKENLPVISPAGLVGRISELGLSTAKVTLLTDPAFCVSAIIQNSRQQGLVCGTLEDYLVMRYLDDERDIRIKDKVITAGLTELFPKGILIGEIIEVKKDPLDNRLYGKIKPAVDFNKLEEVMVILK